MRVYCESCGVHRPFRIEPMQRDTLNGNLAWGDVVCVECHLVVATFSADEPGTYDFMLVSSGHKESQPRP